MLQKINASNYYLIDVMQFRGMNYSILAKPQKEDIMHSLCFCRKILIGNNRINLSHNPTMTQLDIKKRSISKVYVAKHDLAKCVDLSLSTMNLVAWYDHIFVGAKCLLINYDSEIIYVESCITIHKSITPRTKKRPLHVQGLLQSRRN